MDDIISSYSSFYYTKTGIIIPTITGSVSFLSSALIIFIIIRTVTATKHKWSAYYRIIFGLSLADCFTSLAIALTTIPMPKNVIYPFEMPSYGNILTCEVQAFTYITGNGLIFAMNGILNIYYLCTLRYNMQESKFKCYVEIPLYITALALVFGLSCATLIKQELLNPSPTDPFCVSFNYPVGCSVDDNPECRGGGGQDSYWAMYLGTMAAGSFTLLFTMSLIIHSFCRNERRLLKLVKNDQIQDEDENLIALKIAQEQTGIITRQALMYVAAFVVSWIFRFLEYLWQEGAVDFTDQGLKWLFTLRMLFQPSQGFFNLMIFLYHKVYVLRTSCDEDVSLVKAIGIIVVCPEDTAEANPISNLNAGIDEYFHTASVNISGPKFLITNSRQILYDEIEDPPSVQHGDILARIDLSDDGNLSDGFSVDKDESQMVYYKNITGILRCNGSYFRLASNNTTVESFGPSIDSPRLPQRFSRICQSTVQYDSVGSEDDGDISISSSRQDSLSSQRSSTGVSYCSSEIRSGGASLGGLSNL